jgi:hypothetical protein
MTRFGRNSDSAPSSHCWMPGVEKETSVDFTGTWEGVSSPHFEDE